LHWSQVCQVRNEGNISHSVKAVFLPTAQWSASTEESDARDEAISLFEDERC
jgi:hypothetical protein